MSVAASDESVVTSSRPALVDRLAARLRVERRWVWPVVALLAFINGLVLFNAIYHPPSEGYDAAWHRRYVRTLARDWRLPEQKDTREYFSPPAPYVVPGLAGSIARAIDRGNPDDGGAIAIGLRIGQFAQVIVSLVTCFGLLAICQIARPGDGRTKLLALLMLALLPVYYKSFAMIRGEPYLAMLAVLATVQFLRLARATTVRDSAWHAAWLGLWLGLGILTRQWGFFVLPALVLAVFLTWFARHWTSDLRIGGWLAVSFVVAALVGSWFYLSLYERYGRFTAFNRAPGVGSIWEMQPREFFFDLKIDEMVTIPVREHLSNRLIPIFYSEMWGDYWGFFARAHGAQEPSVVRYLGRANVVSLVPAMLLLVGLAWGLIVAFRRALTPDHRLTTATCALIVLASAAGYLWFLLRYPSGDGDTIKATYMLHTFPMLAVLAGMLLADVTKRWPRVGVTIVVLLLLVLIHNLPLMLTRFGADLWLR